VPGLYVVMVTYPALARLEISPPNPYGALPPLTYLCPDPIYLLRKPHHHLHPPQWATTT